MSKAFLLPLTMERNGLLRFATETNTLAIKKDLQKPSRCDRIGINVFQTVYDKMARKLKSDFIQIRVQIKSPKNKASIKIMEFSPL